MLSGRIMIVSDRNEVVAELEPIIRAGHHLALTVADGGEARRILDEGVVPDLVISDPGSRRAPEGVEYVRRFREMNRVGHHLVVLDPGTSLERAFGGGPAWLAEQVTPLARPFDPQAVQGLLEEAVLMMQRELHALRAEVWREMARMQQTMRDMQRETVNALAATIAARDPYMHGHATRVAALCRQVAGALLVSPEDAQLLETAALLHEIGKASVPLELLHKTEPLSPEELQRIRGHARTGADIVRGVPLLRRLAPIIEHQGTDHAELSEHLDATGTEFLLAGILRAADAWDAMASPRSYRAAMPREYREAALRGGAGTRFHPRVVGPLLALTSLAPPPAGHTP